MVAGRVQHRVGQQAPALGRADHLGLQRHAAHHVHVLTVDSARDRIATDRVWCGGRWDAALLAQMGQAEG